MKGYGCLRCKELVADGNRKRHQRTCPSLQRKCTYCGSEFRQLPLHMKACPARVAPERHIYTTAGTEEANPGKSQSTTLEAKQSAVFENVSNHALHFRLYEDDSPFSRTVRACHLPRLEDVSGEDLDMFGKGRFDRPQISSLSHWIEPIDKRKISLAVLGALSTTKVKLEVWREGRPVDTPKYARECAEKVYYAFVSNDHATDDCWLNFPVPTLNSAMTIPRDLMDHKTEYGKRVGVNVNTALSGSTCDLHHDEQFVVTTLIGGTKVWAIFPPTSHNLETLTKAYQRKGRFSEYCSKLDGGILVEQRNGQTLWLPPACPHATLSIESSMLAGQELRFTDDFHRTIDCLAASLTVENSSAVWDRFASGFIASLAAHARSELQIIESWNANHKFLEKHMPARFAHRIDRHWRHYLENSKVEICPSCNDNSPSLDFSTHMKEVHIHLSLESSSAER